MTPTKPVLTAVKDLPAGHVITRNDFTVVKYPEAVLPNGAIADIKNITGKTLKKDILSGEVLRLQHLSSNSPIPAQLEGRCPKNWAAVELPLGTAQGLSSLRPGDRVDIFGEVPVTVAPDKTGTAVDIIAQNAVIISVPEKEGRDTFVVAVAPESVPALAEAVVRDKKLAVVVVNR